MIFFHPIVYALILQIRNAEKRCMGRLSATPPRESCISKIFFYLMPNHNRCSSFLPPWIFGSQFKSLQNAESKPLLQAMRLKPPTPFGLVQNRGPAHKKVLHISAIFRWAESKRIGWAIRKKTCHFFSYPTKKEESYADIRDL